MQREIWLVNIRGFRQTHFSADQRIFISLSTYVSMITSSRIYYNATHYKSSPFRSLKINEAVPRTPFSLQITPRTPRLTQQHAQTRSGGTEAPLPGAITARYSPRRALGERFRVRQPDCAARRGSRSLSLPGRGARRAEERGGGQSRED